MEILWLSGQGLKVSTPRSRVRTPDNAISTGRSLGFNSRRMGGLCIKLEKMLTGDLQHGARSTVRNGSHRATQSDAVRRESS